MTVYEIIETIAATPSTNEKLDILHANKDNELLKKVFYYAYNPRFNYWIKPEDFYPPSIGCNVEFSDELFNDLDKLINHEITGDRARNLIVGMMATLNSGSQEILRRIMLHDLRCGASDTIASKVWKNLVPEYPVMLSQKFNAKNQEYLKKHEGKGAFNNSLKEDGGRLLITVEDGKVTLRSRNGSTLNTFNLFDSYFEKCGNNVFDSELTIKNPDGTPNRKLSNGIYTKLVRNTASREEVALFSIVLWDVVPLDEYLIGIGTKPYSYRLNELKLYENYFWQRSPIKIVENTDVATIEECIKFYEEMRERGQEGSIIKLNSAVWEDKRSKNSIKLKAEDTGDFLCTGVEEGQGKYAGMIGALHCRSSCGKIKFSVGTGLKDADRDLNIPYTGSIIEVKYNSLISSKSKSTYSLFLPVYSCMRPDKNIANSFCDLE